MSMVLAAFILIGCKDNGIQNKELPLTISQENWAESKKYVELSTGIKMAYVEMIDPNGQVVILQHGMTGNSCSRSLAAPYFA